MDLEKLSSEAIVSAVIEKLNHIAGAGKMIERDWRARNRLRWHTKAKSAVRHLLNGERRPSLDEAREIEAAHLKYCAEQIEVNRAANAKLFDTMQQSIAAMQTSDPDFYRPHIEALGETLLRLRNGVN